MADPLLPPSRWGANGTPPPSAPALRGRGTPPWAAVRGTRQCDVPAPTLAHGRRVASGRGADLRNPPHGGRTPSNARLGRGLGLAGIVGGSHGIPGEGGGIRNAPARGVGILVCQCIPCETDPPPQRSAPERGRLGGGGRRTLKNVLILLIHVDYPPTPLGHGQFRCVVRGFWGSPPPPPGSPSRRSRSRVLGAPSQTLCHSSGTPSSLRSKTGRSRVLWANWVQRWTRMFTSDPKSSLA